MPGAPVLAVLGRARRALRAAARRSGRGLDSAARAAGGVETRDRARADKPGDSP